MKQLPLLTLPILALLISPNFTFALDGKIDMHGTEQTQKAQIYYGKVLEIKPAMGYKYLKLDENGTTTWVAIANAPVTIGDKIGFDKKTVMKNFKSKSLGQDFKEIYFASDVYLPQKTTAPKSMKAMLGLGTKKDPHAGMGKGMSPEIEEKPAKPFEKKESYTIEEIHMWRKDLDKQTITIKGTVFKVSKDIMKRDWVHIGDNTGNEKKLTDDLVFTATNTNLKSGDTVLAKGVLAVNKDFGYGYFYPVIIEDSTFKVTK
jgi:predicted heme/steroid binding protein